MDRNLKFKRWIARALSLVLIAAGAAWFVMEVALERPLARPPGKVVFAQAADPQVLDPAQRRMTWDRVTVDDQGDPLPVGRILTYEVAVARRFEADGVTPVDLRTGGAQLAILGAVQLVDPQPEEVEAGVFKCASGALTTIFGAFADGEDYGVWMRAIDDEGRSGGWTGPDLLRADLPDPPPPPGRPPGLVRGRAFYPLTYTPPGS